MLQLMVAGGKLAVVIAAVLVIGVAMAMGGSAAMANGMWVWLGVLAGFGVGLLVAGSALGVVAAIFLLLDKAVRIEQLLVRLEGRPMGGTAAIPGTERRAPAMVAGPRSNAQN